MWSGSNWFKTGSVKGLCISGIDPLVFHTRELLTWTLCYNCELKCLHIAGIQLVFL